MSDLCPRCGRKTWGGPPAPLHPCIGCGLYMPQALVDDDVIGEHVTLAVDETVEPAGDGLYKHTLTFTPTVSFLPPEHKTSGCPDCGQPWRWHEHGGLFCPCGTPSYRHRNEPAYRRNLIEHAERMMGEG